jgi:hypothetical protein
VVEGSNLIISNVTFIPGDQLVKYPNPIVLGMGSGNCVDISYSIFINISITRVSLFYSCESTEFYLTDNSFRCGELFFCTFF